MYNNSAMSRDDHNSPSSPAEACTRLGKNTPSAKHEKLALEEMINTGARRT